MLEGDWRFHAEIPSCWRVMASWGFYDCPIKTTWEGDPVIDQNKVGSHSGTWEQWIKSWLSIRKGQEWKSELEGQQPNYVLKWRARVPRILWDGLCFLIPAASVFCRDPTGTQILAVILKINKNRLIGWVVSGVRLLGTNLKPDSCFGSTM